MAVDAAAALCGTLVLGAAQRHPLLVAGLVTGVTGWNARAALSGARAAVPAVLDELPALVGRIAVGWCVLATLLAGLAPRQAISLGALLAGCAVQSTACWAGRGAVYWRRRRAAEHRPRTALVIGSGPAGQRVAAAFLRHPGCGIRPVGIVSWLPGDRWEGATGSGLPVLSSPKEVQRALIQNGVSVALVVEPGRQHGLLLRILADQGCELWGIEAVPPRARTPYDSAAGPDPQGHLAGFPCVLLSPPPRPRGGVSKRVLDVLASGVLLLLSCPVLLVCAVVLWVIDGPGVVFRQERIGNGGRTFTLLKFRTHRPADPHEAATRWSVADEQRMSGFCRFLRRTSLDELLQLWNVFRGDMSLVGPRPERPYFVAKFSQAHPGYAARHRMRTGITGLAQIHGLRGDTSIEDRARFDNAYIDNWSLWQDICILLRTAVALLRPTGS